jgi:hypothetical protein
MTSRKNSAASPLLSGAALTDDDHPRDRADAASGRDVMAEERRAPNEAGPGDPRRRRAGTRR